MSKNEDINELLYLCFLLINSETGKPILKNEEWKNDAQALGVKLFRHITSAQTLTKASTFKYKNLVRIQYIDHSSVAIAIRAAIETYLAFNYIFANENINLSIFRHSTWCLGGLLDRSKLFANTPESIDKLAKEAELILELKEKVQSSQYFIDSNRDTKKDILSGKWKPKGGWNNLGGHANIHQTYFDDIYNHLSGHSHASYISAMQTRDAQDIQSQRMLADSTEQIACLMLAHFTFAYIKLFPNAKKITDLNKPLYEIARKWHIQKEDVDFLYKR